MKLIAWLVIGVILGGGGWFFCRCVGNKSRNKGGLHGGGIESASNIASDIGHQHH